MGGVPVGRDPCREEFCGRNHMVGVLYGRNPNGTSTKICILKCVKNAYLKMRIFKRFLHAHQMLIKDAHLEHMEKCVKNAKSVFLK